MKFCAIVAETSLDQHRRREGIVVSQTHILETELIAGGKIGDIEAA